MCSSRWRRRYRRQEAEEELIERLRESVRLRMISEVPAGSVPVRRRRFERGGGDDGWAVREPVKTCSISFSIPHTTSRAMRNRSPTDIGPVTSSIVSKATTSN